MAVTCVLSPPPPQPSFICNYMYHFFPTHALSLVPRILPPCLVRGCFLRSSQVTVQCLSFPPCTQREGWPLLAHPPGGRSLAGVWGGGGGGASRKQPWLSPRRLRHRSSLPHVALAGSQQSCSLPKPTV